MGFNSGFKGLTLNISRCFLQSSRLSNLVHSATRIIFRASNISITPIYSVEKQFFLAFPQRTQSYLGSVRIEEVCDWVV